MKKSVITEIFNGKRGTCESMKFSRKQNNPEDSFDPDKDFVTKLNPTLLELYNKLMYSLESSQIEEIDFYFTEGFKLGLLIGKECFEEQ